MKSVRLRRKYNENLKMNINLLVVFSHKSVFLFCLNSILRVEPENHHKN